MKGIWTLWMNWLVANVALMLVLALSVWVPQVWMPVPVLLIALGVLGYMRLWRLRTPGGECGLTPWLILRVLCVSVLVMLVISVLYERGYAEEIYERDALNADLPYVSVLVQAPIVALLSAWVLLRGHANMFCRYCLARYGTQAERGFMGEIFGRESMFQVKVLFITTLAVSIEAWTYYLLCYTNVNFNEADVYFLVVLPVFIRVMSVAYLGARYFSLWGYYSQDNEHVGSNEAEATLLRYLVVHKDSLYIKLDDDDDSPGRGKYDTPASIYVTKRAEVPLPDAARIFAELSGMEAPENPGPQPHAADKRKAHAAHEPQNGWRIRFMYSGTTATGKTHIFHYIVETADEAEITASNLRGQWARLHVVQDLLNRGQLAPMLASEIARLYRVAMAWKTYDINGRRLYHIKDYKPMFRLNGIIDWGVDFNDPRWLEVARDNEDSRFYHLRHLWRKVIRKMH